MISNDLDIQRLLTREHAERLAQEARNEWLARDLRETKRARRGRRRILALPTALGLAGRRPMLAGQCKRRMEVRR